MAYPFRPNPTWGELIAVLQKKRRISICITPGVFLQHIETGETIECQSIQAKGYGPYGMDRVSVRAGLPVTWTVLHSIGLHFDLDPGEDFGLTAGWPGPFSDPS